MPMPAALGLVVALVFGVLSMILPWSFKIITLPISFCALSIAIIVLFFGDDLQWIGIKVAGLKKENGRVSSEVGEASE